MLIPPSVLGTPLAGLHTYCSPQMAYIMPMASNRKYFERTSPPDVIEINGGLLKEHLIDFTPDVIEINRGLLKEDRFFSTRVQSASTTGSL
eukprot:847493-Pelagomonas_calceolata.AAC.3